MLVSTGNVNVPMNELLPELLPELLELVFFGLVGAGLSVAGVVTERFAVSTALTGQPKVGLWFAFIGALILFFAYLVATDKCYPRLRAVAQELR